MPHSDFSMILECDLAKISRISFVPGVVLLMPSVVVIEPKIVDPHTIGKVI
jgi:hypothetical protein